MPIHCFLKLTEFFNSDAGKTPSLMIPLAPHEDLTFPRKRFLVFGGRNLNTRWTRQVCRQHRVDNGEVRLVGMQVLQRDIAGAGLLVARRMRQRRAHRPLDRVSLGDTAQVDAHARAIERNGACRFIEFDQLVV